MLDSIKDFILFSEGHPIATFCCFICFYVAVSLLIGALAALIRAGKK